MVAEPVVNQPSTSTNQIKKLKSEIGSLKGRFEEIKKQVEQKTKYLKYGASGEIPEKPFYILIKRKSGDWFLFGKYNTEQEYKDAINKIKSEKGRRHSNVSDYYVTFSEKEVERFLKGSRYKEKQYHEKIKKEISRLPTTRWSENVREGLKVPEEKTISKEVAEYSGYSGKPSGMMPRMSVGVWGSISQPRKTNLPSFGALGRTRQPTKIKKTIIDHDEFKELLDQGYSRDELESQGIVDKFSRYYQEKSVFPGAVAYKPVSMNQVFTRVTPPKTPYQRRVERGEKWQGFRPIPIQNTMFRPFTIGMIDPVTGERTTTYKPRKYSLW